MLENIVGVNTPTPFRITHFIPNSENRVCVADDVDSQRRRCMAVHPSMLGGDGE